MGYDLIETWPLHRVERKNLVDQILDVVAERDVLWETVGSHFNFLVSRLDVGGFERRSSNHQSVASMSVRTIAGTYSTTPSDQTSTS